MNNSGIRVLLGNKHQLFRSGLISLLNNCSEVFVVGEASTGIDIINKYFLLLPDILLSDISMPVMSGIDATKKIRERDKNIKTIFITSYYSEEYFYYCIKAGAYGLLSRDITIGEMTFAFKEVYNGRKYFGKIFCEEKLIDIVKRYEQLDKLALNQSLEKLGEKEESILVNISEGLTSRQIALRMNLSKRTVDTYRSNIMQKYDLKSLPELIKFAISYTNQKNFVIV